MTERTNPNDRIPLGLLDALSLAIVVIDPQGRVVMRNHLADDVPVDANRDRVEAHLTLRDQHGTPLPNERQPVPLLLDQGVPTSGLHAFLRRPCGQLHAIILDAGPWEGPGPGTGGFVLSWAQVDGFTERVPELAESRRRMAALLDGITDDVYRLDPLGRVLDAHLATTSRPRSPPARPIERIDDFLPPIAADELRRASTEAIRTGELVVTTLTLDDRPGPGILEARLSPAGGGEVVCVLRDVTDQAQAIRELERSREELKLAQRIARLGSYATDLRTGQRSWSEEMFLILGYDPAGPIPTYEEFARGFHPDDRDRAMLTLRRAIERNEAYSDDLRWFRNDGRMLHLQSAGVPIRDADGRTVAMYGTLMDITERKNFEQQLVVAREAAIALSSVKSRFLANMSHEIRTPMNGIIGMATLALESTDPDETRDMIRGVLDSAEPLLRIIDDILDISRIEAQRMELEHVPFRLRDLIEEVARPLAIRARQKGIDLRLRIGPAVRDPRLGDPVRVRQILTNLLANAVKFTAVGGVSVDVDIDPQSFEDERLRFVVQDTGIGIAPEAIDRVFQPFVQADETMTRRFGGTGLGLAVSAQLVQLMDGHISVESTPGAGSCFTFDILLPRGDEDQATGPTLPTELVGLRVLIVDDDEPNRRALARMFEGCGSIVHTAVGADDAMAHLLLGLRQHAPFGVLLLDDQLPGTTGLDLAARISRDRSLRDPPPILLLSSDGRSPSPADYARSGIVSCLPKPVSRDDLLRTIQLAVRWHLHEARSGLRAGVPRTTPTSATRPTAAARHRGLDVLLVEDNVVNRLVASRMLEKLGHRVRNAEHGEAALAAFDEQKFDLVLMDLQMPDVDGFEVTRRIRDREARNDLRRTPIIALTAHAMRGDDRRCLDAGMDAYLAKPLRLDDLVEVIECFTRWRRPLPGGPPPPL